MSLNYRPLDDASNEIRVIQLLACPGDRTSPAAPPVRCRLKHVTPKTCPKYYALSYVWGDCGDLGELEVLYTSDSGLEEQWETIPVQKSLESALKHIRRGDRSLVLWADALCINQTDEEEKSIQVQRMRWIYENAFEILIWLGPAADGSDDLLATLMEIGEDMGEVSWKDGLFLDVFHQASHIWSSSCKGEPQNPTEWFIYRICGRIPGKRVPSIAAFVALLKRPWWTRTWIILEYASKRDGYFVCGDSRIPNYLLFCVTNVYAALKHALNQQSCTTFFNPGTYEKEIMLCQDDGFENFHMLQLTCTWVKTQPFISVAAFYRMKWPHQFQCSNPRDHVYALAGLASDSLPLRPDYTKSVGEVYLETSAAILQSGQLDILTFCQRDRNFSSLPSWVIDWTANMAASPVFGLAKYSFGPYFCARERIRPSSISHATILNDIIHISGICIGSVGLVGYTMPELARSSHTKTSPFQRPVSPSEILATPDLLRRWLEEFCALLPRSGVNVNEEPYQKLSKVVSGIFADLYQFRVGVTEDVVTKGLIELFTKADHEADVDLMKPFLWIFYECLSSDKERPFVSRDGRLGIATENVEQGDFIVHFPGASLPSLIRQVDAEYCRIVGPALLDGFMNGEAFTGELEPKLLKIR